MRSNPTGGIRVLLLYRKLSCSHGVAAVARHKSRRLCYISRLNESNMTLLIILALVFYGFIAWAPQQVQQMCLALTWGLFLLGTAGLFLYYLGRFLLS